MAASSYTQLLTFANLTLLNAAALAAEGLIGSIDQSEASSCKLSVKVKHHDASGPVTNKVLVIVASLEGRADHVHNATQRSAVCGKGGVGRWAWPIRGHPKDQLLALCSPKLG